MQPGQAHNMAIAEVEHNGQLATITGTAVTEHDDAIQFIVDMMTEQGISGDKVRRLYSERQPSPEWYEYFERNWPNVKVTWSFTPDEEAEFEEAVGKLLSAKKPWWKFW